MVLSTSHTLSTRENLRHAHERQYEKTLWEEAHGSCHRCKDDYADPPSCKDCINAGGKKDMFREKPRRHKLRSAAGVR